ncbi:uncharacterized protein LY89DRAFT_681599 [Mollisia scopiformis]|uniref:TMEM205-like domain-containing protein n=1 Tax=Mollisia scopiformis TaxID=149040 RepID=A0A194XLB3_MOLSC|nr:uncharacterized protein LY89DRAFT_681599 [Mollisia scopiformis]KUJ20968.1 hypothetical protein LY89DRAFT_681599 [Mollisia scopiformis]
MPDLSIFKSPAPYHIIAYGTLLGTEFFQTFVGGIVSYQALPRPQFSQLQQKLFPVYFGLQTTLPAILALTYPGSRTSLGPSSGISGTFADVNRWTVLAPIATIFVTSAVNMLYCGPETTRIMRKRKVQETRDGKKYHDPAPQSTEMQQLNKAFAWMHGASSLVNLVGYIATIWYGFSLAERIS